MNSDITVEALPLLGVCNLCLGNSAVESMILVNKFNGIYITYSEMLIKCLGIDISTLNIGDMKQVICQDCIEKLKECMQFRKLAEKSLKALVSKAEEIRNALEVDVDVKYTINEDVKSELGSDGDGFDCEDNEVLADLLKEARGDCESEHKTDSTNEFDYISLLNKGLFLFKTYKKHYSCVACSHKTTSIDSLYEHMKNHTKKYLKLGYKKHAGRCNFFFERTNLLCKVCTTAVSNFEEVKLHLQTCVREKRWRNSLPFKLDKNQSDCPICKKNFLNYVSLNIHMNTHYPHFVCDNCGKPFASLSRLKSHIRTHEIGDFPCKICGLVFDKITKRENHVSREHKSGVKYSCKKCSESFTSFYARQKHLAVMHDEDLKKYKCKACTRSYVTPGHLSSHVRRDHLIERNYKCDKCDLAFYTRNSLKMHMIKHDGERIHICQICQKSYQRKKTLIEHLRIHNNDKRFVCTFCGRAFTQKCTLKGHMKLHEIKIEGDRKLGQMSSV